MFNFLFFFQIEISKNVLVLKLAFKTLICKARYHCCHCHHPPLALLDEVPEREGRLLPHLALDEVERVALLEGAHREEAVLGHRAVQPVVERHLPLGPDLEITNNLECREVGRIENAREVPSESKPRTPLCRLLLDGLGMGKPSHSAQVRPGQALGASDPLYTTNRSANNTRTVR